MALSWNKSVPSTEAPDQGLQSPITFWSLTLGTFLTVMATLAGSYARYVLHTTRLDQNHLSVAAVFPLLLIALFLVRPLKLSRGELVVIFIMPLIGSTMPTYFIGKMMAYIAVPHYGATPENQWAIYYGNLPAWAAVPSGQGLQWYYEGLPKGMSIPWEIWIAPVFWWITVIAAFYGCCLCLMVILRKQWIEHERIGFPLMEMPLAILEETDKEGIFSIPILNQRIFWIGFGLSAGIILWNIISYFNPTIPVIPHTSVNIEFGRVFPPIRTRLYPMVVGFAYFINLDISFSLWFFNLVTTLEIGAFNAVGYSAGASDGLGTDPLAIGAQAMGGFMVTILTGFWMAREHLQNVVRKAFKGDDTVDDSDEIMAYRTAVYGFLACSAYLACWLFVTGMDIRMIPIFLFGVLVLFLGLTRVIAETGLISIRAPLMPQELASYIMGTQGLSQQAMVGVAFSYFWVGDTKTTMMPALGHTVKLFDTLHAHKRRLLWSVLIAMAVGVMVSFIYTIYIGYTYGAVHTGGLTSYPWENLVTKSKSPFGVRWEPLNFIAIGALVTAFLMALRYRFPWWPCHPIGFAAGSVYPVNIVIFPIFVAWFLKLLILRMGGIQTYRSGRPFFIGLILGHFVGAGISFIVDMIWFPGQGHAIRFSD